MEINRSGFYKYLERKDNPSPKMIQRLDDLEKVKIIHQKHPSHGYRWIKAKLMIDFGIARSNQYVHRLCKYGNIRSKAKRAKWSSPGTPKKTYPNIIKNEWDINKPYQVIVSDMTAFRVAGKYYELTLYMDVFNNEILSYSLGKRRGEVKPYYDGLNDLLAKIGKNNGSILHTDQGAVYASHAYNDILEDYKVNHSMSRAGTPTDNPIMESINGWMKEELFLDFNLMDSTDVQSTIDSYIKYYNEERPAYSLDYKTPIQYKKELGF